MSLYYYEPFYTFDRLLGDNWDSDTLDKNSKRVTEGQTSDGAIRAMKPRMDLHEDSNKNVVRATFELPGLKKEDVNIDVSNNRLTISGESKISDQHEEKGYVVKERRYGKFSRTLNLPPGVKDEQIKAELKDGLLTVTFPKAGSPEQQTKKITIN
ncbi:hypothetical protein D9613_003150 [Agrocybe pediades]|uniref:Small heat shock protein n=1 Tax=Agrocybe pediades TaxID=84607 RepID=A0A8H4QQ68_9AGAR|nr:hypothetical protein D9613_003150 [Agrocybe pediades]